MLLNNKLKQALIQNKAVKIITGLNNFNLNTIINKVKAAELAGATYVDIAANIEIVHEVKQVCSLPICVSSIDVDELYSCFKAGADILEIGNFDCFYEQGIIFSSDCIYSLAQEIVSRAPEACICVTIPHLLSLFEQIKLAKKLENLGIDLIQTEGMSSKVINNLSLINSYSYASASLSTTYLLAQNIGIPIISASGLNVLSAPIAISCGASGVGIGSFISKFNDLNEMSLIIKLIVQSIDHHRESDAINNSLLLSPTFDLCNT